MRGTHTKRKQEKERGKQRSRTELDPERGRQGEESEGQ